MLSWRLAWRNIWRHPVRTQLTLAAMVFSSALLVFMVAMQTGMYAMMIENTLRLSSGHYQIQAPGYLEHPAINKTLENGQQLAADLRQQYGRVFAARVQGFALLSSEQRSYAALISGVELKYEADISSIPGLVSQGQYLQREFAREIVLGEVLARNLRVQVGDELTLLSSAKDGSIAADVLRIVGLLQTANQELDRLQAHIPIDVFQDIFSMGEDVHMVVLTAHNLDASDRIATQLREKHNHLLYSWHQLEPGLMQAIKADISSAVMMYAVLVVLSGFSVLNTILMAVLERTREFGIVMALGVRAGQISRMILLEALMLSLLGLLLGMIVGGGITAYFELNGLVIPGYEEAAARFNLPERVYPSVDPVSLLSGPLFVFVSALFASLYPALRVLRFTPVQAMRARP